MRAPDSGAMGIRLHLEDGWVAMGRRMVKLPETGRGENLGTPEDKADEGFLGSAKHHGTWPALKNTALFKRRTSNSLFGSDPMIYIKFLHEMPIKFIFSADWRITQNKNLCLTDALRKFARHFFDAAPERQNTVFSEKINLPPSRARQYSVTRPRHHGLRLHAQTFTQSRAPEP